MKNNGQSRRRFQLTVTGFLLLLSMVILFIAGKMVSLPSESPKRLASRAAGMAAAQCTTALKVMGIHYDNTDNLVSVIESGVRPLVGWAERGSLVIQSCPGYALKSFCAGDQCLPEPGMKIVLKRVQ